MARKPTDTVAVTLRIPEELRRRLERAAKSRDTSLNAEMMRRLEDSFSQQDMKAAIIEAVQTATASFVPGLASKKGETK